MNKEDNEKLSSFDKIDYDIAMEIYFKHNDRIARINEHLGEMYDYNDLQNAIDCKKDDELNEYKNALKEKCDAIDKATEYIEHLKEYPFLERYYVIDLLKVLKGEEND